MGEIAIMILASTGTDFLIFSICSANWSTFSRRSKKTP
jgi:hypothetical protein